MDDEASEFCCDCSADVDDGGTCDACGLPLCLDCRIRYTDGTAAECERCMDSEEDDDVS